MWKTNKEKKTYKKNLFYSETEIKQYLESLFLQLNKEQEYNIYLHEIHGYYDTMLKISGEQVMKVKMENIIKNGLSLDKYSSLSGTSMLVGSTKNVNTNTILDYNYYNDENFKIICVIAIPKYISIDGKNVEYSSYTNVDTHNMSKELTDKYLKEVGYLPDIHHRKCSLFDSIKKHNALPDKYLLGFIINNKNTSSYEFIQTDFHLGFVSLKEKQEHDNQVVNLIKSLYQKHKTKTIPDIIVKEYKELEKIYEITEEFDI